MVLKVVKRHLCKCLTFYAVVFFVIFLYTVTTYNGVYLPSSKASVKTLMKDISKCNQGSNAGIARDVNVNSKGSSSSSNRSKTDDGSHSGNKPVYVRVFAENHPPKVASHKQDGGQAQTLPEKNQSQSEGGSHGDYQGQTMEGQGQGQNSEGQGQGGSTDATLWDRVKAVFTTTLNCPKVWLV
jgi:hypothetical protein